LFLDVEIIISTITYLHSFIVCLFCVLYSPMLGIVVIRDGSGFRTRLDPLHPTQFIGSGSNEMRPNRS